MFCDKCGTTLTDDAKFCVNCGSKIFSIEEIESDATMSNYTPTPPPPKTVYPSPRKKNTGIYILIGVIVLILLAVISLLIIRITNPSILSRKDNHSDELMGESMLNDDTKIIEEVMNDAEIHDIELPVTVEVEPEQTPTVTSSISDDKFSEEVEVAFKDPEFEKMVRIALDKPSEVIYQNDLDKVNKLSMIGEKFAWINDNEDFVLDFWGESNYSINGEKYIAKGSITRVDDLALFNNLTELRIIHHAVKNVDGVSKAKKLKIVNLSANQITDISTIYDSISLESIKLGLNKIIGVDDASSIKVEEASFEVFNATRYIGVLDCGYGHTLGVDSRGNAMSMGTKANNNKTLVTGWDDVIAVAAGSDHSLGLLKDGTVTATGSNKTYGQCNVSHWTDIVMISANGSHSVGLKADGRVVAAGLNNDGQTDVSEWRDIVMISAGSHHTVGLKNDGSVVAVGSNGSGRSNLDKWTNIVAVAAGSKHTVGLKSDGTVVAKGWDGKYQLNVQKWKNIVNIAAGEEYTLGLTSEGNVKLAGSLSKRLPDQKDVLCLFGGPLNAIIIKNDFTVEGYGNNDYGKNNIGAWTNLDRMH